MCTKAISVSDNKAHEKRKRCSKNLERLKKKKMKMKRKEQVGFFK